jgi:hypothetical protein
MGNALNELTSRLKVIDRGSESDDVTGHWVYRSRTSDSPLFLYEKMKRATNSEFKYIDERSGCERIAVRLRKERNARLCVVEKLVTSSRT